MDQLIEVAGHPSSKGIIMKSFSSFIICIFATMYDGVVSAVDGRLVSYCFCLLRVLLPSGPS